MPKRNDIDSIFREIADNHEVKYNPQDWKDCQARMRARAILSSSSLISNRLVRTTVLLSLLLILSINISYTPSDKSLAHYQNQKIKKSQSIDNQLVKSLFELSQKSQFQEKYDKNSTINKSVVQESVNKSQESLAQINWANSSKGNAYPIPKKPIEEDIIKERPIDNIKSQIIDSQDFISKKESIALLQAKELSLTENTISKLVFNDLATTKEDTNYTTKDWHFALISNPQKTKQQVNQKSLNLVLGMSAGLNGWEVSGIGNYEKDYVRGTQVAGIFNASIQEVKGLQIAGLLNFTNKLRGTQIAGLVNLAGFKETQPKISDENITPHAKFNSQIAGLINADLRNRQNLQVSLLANVAKDISGLQFSHFVNVAEKVKGVQFSTVNVAKSVNGTQIGLLNIADSVKGVPIGLLSIVRKNGLQRLEFWTGETFQTNFGYKIGVKKFYNIFSLASQFNGKDFRWGLGYGFGTQIDLQRAAFLNIDLIGYHINEKLLVFTRELNLLSQIRVNYNLRFKNKVNLFFGPTVNTLFSDYENRNKTIGSNIAPWILYEGNAGNTKVKMWLGLNFGMSF